MLKRTDFSPWNFRSADGFTFSSRPKLENIAVLRCYSFFSRGRSCFSPRPGLCGAARREWNFGVETSLVFAVKFAASAAKFAQKANRSGSWERLCPREISASPRGEGFCRRVISTLAPQTWPYKKQPGAHCARLFPVDFTGLTPFCTSVWGGPPCRTRSPSR